MAQIIDGKAISQAVKDEIKARTAELSAKGITATLAVILVGEDPASLVYVKNKKKACEYCGIRSLSYELPSDTTEEKLLELIAELNDVLAANQAEFDTVAADQKIQYIVGKLSAANAAIFKSLPESVSRQLALERDPHGNVQVSLIETEKLLSTMVAQKLEKMKKEGKYVGKFGTQHHFFGYEGRCAAPSNFDADYCYALGTSAAQLIANGKTGYMAIVKNTTAPADQWIAGGVPITMMMNMEKRAGEMKPVIRKALVELDGAPFKYFAAHRDEWARKTAYVYPGPIQYW